MMSGICFKLLIAGKNGRTVYRSKSERFFLYYEDWGSNQGSNWMISADFRQSEALVTSPNVEHLGSFCVDRLGELNMGAWLVSSAQGWLEDRSLRVECVMFQDGTNTLLNTYKTKLRKKNDINRNKVIYNY